VRVTDSTDARNPDGKTFSILVGIDRPESASNAEWGLEPAQFVSLLDGALNRVRRLAIEEHAQRNAPAKREPAPPFRYWNSHAYAPDRAFSMEEMLKHGICSRCSPVDQQIGKSVEKRVVGEHYTTTEPKVKGSILTYDEKDRELVVNHDYAVLCDDCWAARQAALDQQRKDVVNAKRQEQRRKAKAEKWLAEEYGFFAPGDVEYTKQASQRRRY
jgi:hypothetical protein